MMGNFRMGGTGWQHMNSLINLSNMKKRMSRYYLTLDVKQNDVYKIIHEKKEGI